MISRRALFGIGAGAAATAVVPADAPLRAETYFTEQIIGLDFGRQSSAVIMGNAGEAYGQAVRVGTIAQHSRVISDDLKLMRLAYPSDATLFKAAADAYKSAYLEARSDGCARR